MPLLAKEVTFAPGLNVVSGPSNTGKSYILASIDFCFGAKNPPKPIEQSQLLTEVKLELQTATGSKTIERSWDAEGDITVFSSSLDQTSGDLEPLALKTKHDSEKTDNISAFLLSLFNSADVHLRKNQLNAKQKLSFRTISHFFLVTETEIIAETSPILGSGMYEKTLLQSAFNYLLTGNTEQNLVADPDPKTTKAKKVAQIEVYTQLIDDLTKSLKDKPTETELSQQLAELASTIDRAMEQITESRAAIATRLEARASNWRDLQECESRLIVLHELDQRFELLNKHYISDLERLDFIADGVYAIEQLHSIGCPVCGSTDITIDDRKESDGEAKTNLAAACEREAENIRVLSRDLAQTREGLSAEKDALLTKARTLKEVIESEDAALQQQLAPTMTASRKELDDLLKKKREFFQIEESWKRLSEYQKRKTKLEVERDAIKENRKKGSLLDPFALHGFCQEIRNMLVEWHYITEEMVEFDETAVDIKIGGKPRKSNGKGVRALLHAAFTIGLMRYCVKNSLPHPGFVVLDSPLTTFRGSDSKGESDEVSGDVQQAFFTSLANSTDNQQILILENKTLAASTRAKANYIEFSARPDVGRVGLL